MTINFRQLTQKKLLYTLDFTKSQTIENLIQFLKNLQLNSTNLIIIKKLIEALGLPIIIFVKDFYDKIEAQQQTFSNNQKQRKASKDFNLNKSNNKINENQQQIELNDEQFEQQRFVQTQKQKLQYLSLLAKQVSLNIQISYIKYIHKYGTLSKQLKKKITISKQDKQFITTIKNLQQKYHKIIKQINKSPKNNHQFISQLISQYNYFYQQIILQNSLFDSLMLYAIKFIKNSHNFQMKINNIQEQSIQYSSELSINGSRTILQKSQSPQKSQKKNQSQFQQKILQNLILNENNLQKNQNHQIIDNLEKQHVSPLLTSSVQPNSSLYSSLLPVQQSFLNDTMTADFYSETDNTFKKQKQLLNVINENQNFKKNKTSQLPLFLKQTKPLCCRKFFYENQIISKSNLQDYFPIKPAIDHSNIPQNNIYLSVNSSIQFEDQKFPFSEKSLEIFENLVCAFLNGVGGTIYIGIPKSQKNPQQYVVKGLNINEGQRQAIIKHFRVIGSKIEPDIVTHKLYSVEFVPLKKTNSNNFIAGAYVVQIKIKYGNRDEVYCIKNKDSFYDKFVFRHNNSQNFIIQGRRLLDIVKDRHENPLQIPGIIHTGICERPEIGYVINEYYNDQWNFRKNNSYDDYENYDQYDSYDSYDEIKIKKYKEKTESQATVKIIKETFQNNSFSQKSFENQSQKKNIIVHYEKPQEQEKPKEQNQNQINYFQPYDFEPILKKNNSSNQAYFYVIGLNEKMLQPVLIQKGIFNAIIQEAEQNLKIVVKAFDEESILKIRKILKKIQLKYEHKNIRYYQLSLKIHVNNFKQAIKLLKGFTSKYETDEKNKVLKFHFFKDSLLSWLYLKESGIQGNFVQQKSVLQND